MQYWNATLLYQAGLLLGEGPHWHPGWKKFLYVDIEGEKLGCIDPDTKEVKERNVAKKIGAVVPAHNHKLIVALQGSIEEFDFATGEKIALIKIENDKPHNRCNEGKCDAAGRLWIGTMHIEAKGTAGTLYCFDGRLTKKLSGIKVSNGICWSSDNNTMYYIDSFDYNIKAYDFNLMSGDISNERVVVKIEEPGFIPDGMTIDEEDMLWVAIWGSGYVNRYDPHNGHLIGKVMVDAANVTSCAFGGEQMEKLLITTASIGLDEKQLRGGGSLFIAETGIKGRPVHLFNNVKINL